MNDHKIKLSIALHTIHIYVGLCVMLNLKFRRPLDFLSFEINFMFTQHSFIRTSHNTKMLPVT